MIPLVLMMVWMGMYTQTFLAPVSETDAKILSQTDMNNRAVAGTSIPRNLHAH